MSARRRVVVTGLEVLAPGGLGRDSFWDMMTAGRTATRKISFFDPAPFRSKVAAEADFDARDFGLTSREIARMGRAAQMAVVASRSAAQHAGLEPEDIAPSRMGVTIGTAVAATMDFEEDYRVVSDDGRQSVVDPSLTGKYFYNHFVPTSYAREVAMKVGARGPCTVVSTGCTSGIDAIGHAAGLIQEGSADVMIAGGADAPISPITMACFDAIRATTPYDEDPATASRPFDARRSGFVLGEGAAFFVLEELEHALRRDATIYGEVAGYASRCNAYHMTGLRPDGKEMSDAITSALDEARLPGTSIGYINAHGSGTKQNDIHETGAFKDSLGHHAYDVPVSSIKSMVGHSLGAIGAIEIGACLLAMQNSVVPPTANLHERDPKCDLDYVPNEAREHNVDHALTVGSGFGGFQSAMVLSRTPEVSHV
ncbi:beta-ketoacyl-[acyl-carrier-protein] synthase family protein [Luteipulveratus mongoliensis]|uniref:Beta-ACP synthase n=1 Tax=Luteipulveratus mongoliensis TaxID=571913 RepID=A0A0K1JQ22_9MICO|nr:beta-ketoacyl-[acyl-carrier-protein] synthase family protein [Luteipulveratus mongoliensis]AKU18670.1 beta-ACP synthase [Luteipulveratus mongoliensis]